MKIISHPDNSTSFEIIESQLENPLIDTNHQDLRALKQLALPGFRHRPHHRRNHSDEHDGKLMAFIIMVNYIWGAHKERIDLGTEKNILLN